MLDGLVERRCLPHLAVTDEVGPTFFRAVDRGVVGARLFWSAGGCFVGQPPRLGLGKSTEADIKTRPKRAAINELSASERGYSTALKFVERCRRDNHALAHSNRSTVTALPTCKEHYWSRTPSPRPLRHARQQPSTSARALCNRNSCTASLDESRRGACPRP